MYPILVCYMTDYPEQCLVTCTKYGTCLKCKRSEGELGERLARERRTQRDTLACLSEAQVNTTSPNQFQQLCKEHLLSGRVC